jgi:hypothetical protein
MQKISTKTFMHTGVASGWLIPPFTSAGKTWGRRLFDKAVVFVFLMAVGFLLGVGWML